MFRREKKLGSHWVYVVFKSGRLSLLSESRPKKKKKEVQGLNSGMSVNSGRRKETRRLRKNDQ